MKSIYEELLERVANGEKFHIDFEKRDMKVGKKYLVKNGEYNSERSLDNSETLSIEEAMDRIEKYYAIYKRSTPSERSEMKRRKYFKALPVNELTDEELFVGEYREYAQAVLEGFILCQVLNGNLTWHDEWGTFFYQGNDEDLIILKKWIEK